MPTWFGPYVFFLFVLLDVAMLTAFLGHKTTSCIAFACFAVAFCGHLVYFWRISKKEKGPGVHKHPLTNDAGARREMKEYVRPTIPERSKR